jgi:hypothetical protein
MALGANDPRNRRNDQVELAESDVRIDGTLRIDDRQRLSVAGAIDVGDPPTDSLANLGSWAQNLIDALRNAGLVRGE